MKNKKAAGLDGISPEVWKTGIFNLTFAMMFTINKILTHGVKAAIYHFLRKEIWAFPQIIEVLPSLPLLPKYTTNLS